MQCYIQFITGKKLPIINTNINEYLLSSSYGPVIILRFLHVLIQLILTIILWDKLYPHFYKWGTDRSINVPRDTQLSCSRAKIWIPATWIQAHVLNHSVALFFIFPDEETECPGNMKSGKISHLVPVVGSQSFGIWTQIFLMPVYLFWQEP